MLCSSFFDLLVLCMTAYSMRCIPGAMSFSRQGKSPVAAEKLAVRTLVAHGAPVL
jgi:hypothetical protein